MKGFTRRTLFVFSLSAMVLGGCAMSPKPTGFLSSYAEMARQHELSLVWVDPAARFSEYDTLFIGPINSQYLRKTKLKEKDIEKIVERLNEKFRQEMHYFFRSVFDGMATQIENVKALRLDLALTELNSTLSAAGIEGRFVDMQTGKELARFLDRSWQFNPSEFAFQSNVDRYSSLSPFYGLSYIWADRVGYLVQEHWK